MIMISKTIPLLLPVYFFHHFTYAAAPQPVCPAGAASPLSYHMSTPHRPAAARIGALPTVFSGQIRSPPHGPVMYRTDRYCTVRTGTVPHGPVLYRMDRYCTLKTFLHPTRVLTPQTSVDDLYRFLTLRYGVVEHPNKGYMHTCLRCCALLLHFCCVLHFRCTPFDKVIFTPGQSVNTTEKCC